eukprot:UN05402
MRRGINFNNHEWLKKIEQFGLINSFRNDDTIYKRSLNFTNIVCGKYCICWLKCCLCYSCCSQCIVTNNVSQPKSSERFKDWRNLCDIGTMSYTNSCDYVQKCRKIICPNKSFATHLAEFEESIRNNISTFEQCYACK